jgi:ribonuclease E
MTKRMLIDSTHAEETRVVVLDGNRLEDFDVETSTKKQLKGNIYLAKVVRVEPSLQAAFVEYGGGRHGFLAFGEIHPDYYQIPVADRQRLLRMQAEEARAEDDDDEDDEPTPAAPGIEARDDARAEPDADQETHTDQDAHADHEAGDTPAAQPAEIAQDVRFGEMAFGEVTLGAVDLAPLGDQPPAEEGPDDSGEDIATVETAPEPPPEMLGGESDVFEGNGAEEARARRSARFLRNYRIQEVIKRRQILLIQVVKEERGNKGAALTTYISLAGRFCVLMPNSPKGGGISRKITSAADRRRLKEITAELEVPQGMGLIVRTAGAARPKPEIVRDCEYLMRLWDDIREHTMRSTAPALIYEEASLIKRTIRDVYSRDIDEVLVDGEDGWKAAHDFMRMLMPSHAKKVQLWRPNGHSSGGQPLFSAHGVEAQLDGMLTPNVQLKSGGYLVINQAEALVAIDVNSGRSTRERGIEETALRTNLEAADEVARQLRLRDLAGLIVIDFIDMEAKKHNVMVERRLKEALKNDRARIQVGQISHFGLMEMSRQRLRSSLTETSFVSCPHCAGVGLVRSVESAAIHVLRAIEDEGAKDKASLIMVHAAGAIVMYILNNKRDRLAAIEARTAMRVHFTSDDSLVPPDIRIDRLKPQIPEAERLIAAPVAPTAPLLDVSDESEDEVFEEDEAETPQPAMPVAGESQATADENQRRKRRRRRRGGRRESNGDGNGDGDAMQTASAPPGDDDVANPDIANLGADQPDIAAAQPAPPPSSRAKGLAAAIAAEVSGHSDEPDAAEAADSDAPSGEQPSVDPTELDENGLPRARRRGRRGGRRRRRDTPAGEAEAGEAEPNDAPADAPAHVAPAYVAPPYVAPVYNGPTPANPFGSQGFDIFDMIDQANEQLDIPPPPKAVIEPVAVAPVAITPVAAAPIAVTPVSAEPEPAPPAEAQPEPTPQAEPPAEPKRGWWRRG